MNNVIVKLTFAFLILLTALGANAQGTVVFNFDAAVKNATTKAFEQNGVGIYYANKTGTEKYIINNSTPKCDGRTNVLATSSNTFYFKTALRISSIEINGKPTGNTAPIFGTLKSSSSLTGTYTAITPGGVTNNMANSSATCGNISISGLDIAADTFLEITIQNANMNISSIKFGLLAAWPVIETFTVNGITANINNDDHTISATLPYGTALTAITPVITKGGSATSYSPTGAQDFSNGSVVYSVTNGTETQNYNVSITALQTANNDATLSELNVDNTLLADFDKEKTVYNIALPFAYSGLPNVTAETTKSTSVLNINQVAAIPGSATVTVTAQDGTTQKTYTVNFTRTPASTQANIKSFILESRVGTINGNEIQVFLPSGTPRSNLTPTIKVSEFATVSPTGAQNFNNPVNYTVTAEGGSTKTYTVTTTLMDNSGASVLPDIELPLFIGNHMVLQRDTPIKLWGWGTIGKELKVELVRGNNNFSNTTVVDANGKWSIVLPAQSVSNQPCQLKFSTSDNPTTVRTLYNILIGDVWFASGQSNMEMKVERIIGAQQVAEEAAEYPNIRAFRSAYQAIDTPQEKVHSSSSVWAVCSGSSFPSNVSAVAYIFARKINMEENVPIGILQSYRGATEIETWMSAEKINSGELCMVAGRMAGKDNTDANTYPTLNYNGQVNPIAGFPIKGFLWYQGEGNAKRALEYRVLQKALIEDWRSKWGMGDLPFYYVQLPNSGAATLYEEVNNQQDMRQMQREVLYSHVPNVGMAVTWDTHEDPDGGTPTDKIHPKNKMPVGERLAYLALEKTYNRTLVSQGPTLKSYYFDGSNAYITFNNVGTGLKPKDGSGAELKGFAIAGSNEVFYTTTAEIINSNTVRVSHASVVAPVAVRYAWAKNPEWSNLYNSANLPTEPFKTDAWPSKYAWYENFPSSCAASTDVSLYNIRAGGQPLIDFDVAKKSYTVAKLPNGSNPQITAFANHAFAKVAIAQNETQATITVTAEDNTTTETYTVVFEQTLPVTLVSFKAVEKNNSIVLNWITSTERNNSHFELYKSADGVSFEKIYTVAGKGNSNELQTYTYTDRSPLVGTSYYQLKQIDKDGKAMIFDAVAVKTGLQNDTRFTVHASLEKNNLQLTVYSAENTSAQFQFTDLNGRLLVNKKLNLTKGVQTFNFTITVVPQLYVASLVISDKRLTIKYIPSGF